MSVHLTFGFEVMTAVKRRCVRLPLSLNGDPWPEQHEALSGLELDGGGCVMLIGSLFVDDLSLGG